jgi:hypothetical protein
MQLDAQRATATLGVISGVLSTAELLAMAPPVIDTIGLDFDKSFCSDGGSKAEQTQVRDTSDILSNGTQSPSKTCDGISIGLGFDAVRVELGAIGAPSMVTTTDPCQ